MPIDRKSVPDAATLAKIRDARENAQATCAKTSSGAAGEAGAFNHAPEIFNPMMAGTYTVSSVYGYRIHPTLGYLKLHAGQDYSAPVGTPIYAVAAGTVVEAGMVGGTGMVIIQHEIDGETWYTSYLHMYPDGIYVSKGEKVTPGSSSPEWDPPADPPARTCTSRSAPPMTTPTSPRSSPPPGWRTTRRPN